MSAPNPYSHQPQRFPISTTAPSTSRAPTSVPSSQAATATFPPPRPHPSSTHHLSDPDGTTPYLRDFTLLAEAAKRAQMAVLMRDMEAMGVQ